MIELTLSGVYAKIIKVTEKRKNLAGMCFFGGLVSFGGKLRKFLGSKQKENPTTIYCGREPVAGETRFEHATYGFGDRYSTVEPLP